MYGVTVGKAVEAIRRGALLTTRNLHHQGWEISRKDQKNSAGPRRTFHDGSSASFLDTQADGQVGTRNYWIVVPLVFCENHNIGVLKQAFEEEPGVCSAGKFTADSVGAGTAI